MIRKRLLKTTILLPVILILLAVLGTVVLADADDPEGVSFTLEGCRNDGTITLPNGDDKFVCPDAAYTTGNLGKGWNELDLVPFRITAKAGNSAPESQTYAVAITLDNYDAGHPGYDVLGSDGAGGAPVLNQELSDASCAALTSTAQLDLIPGVGGIDESIYRILEITQAKNTTCVYDWYGRLALGSHLFPGSSLHANLLNQNLGTAGIGAKDVSIPVKEILPQELDKDMTATQGTDHVWNVTKEATPATLSFDNTCAVDGLDPQGLQLTVSWTKGPADPGGPITVITHVYATNPASRVITTNVTDVIYSGTIPLDTINSGDIDVPANTGNYLVLEHKFEAPAGTTDLNDIATATYTDLVTGVPVPGTTTATASADIQLIGPELNQTAKINDVESITGSYLTFSADSFSGASGAFDGGYVAGTATTGPVSWTSDSQGDSGYVTFNKKVYVSQPSEITGVLSDTAELNGSDGAYADADLDVNIYTYAKVSLTINKTIDVTQSADTNFTFKVLEGATEVDEVTVTIAAGETYGYVVVPGLKPGVEYTIDEVDQVGWKPNGDKTVQIDLPECSGSVDFVNISAKDLTVSKTAEPSFTRTFGWTITKEADATYDMFVGDTQDHAYTVAVLKDEGTDSAWKVEGEITVSNPNDWFAISADVSDVFSGADCTVDGVATKPVNVPASGSVTVPYSCSFASQPAYDTTLTNTATATWDAATYGTPTGSASGNAYVVFSDNDPTKLVNDSVKVTDSQSEFGGPYYPTDDRTFDPYEIQFACNEDEGQHINTAKVFGDGDVELDSDTATVTINCYDLTVEKDANTSLTRTWSWTIQKDYDGTYDLFKGDTQAHDYLITLGATSADSAWGVSGTINIYNPAPMDAELTSVTDLVSPDIVAIVDCGGETSVPAQDHISCTYSADLPDATTRTNSATATLQNYDYPSEGTPTKGGTTSFSSPDVSVDFATATINKVDDQVDVFDTYPVEDTFLGTVAWDDQDKTFEYSRTFACDADEGDHINTASFVTNTTGATDSDIATVTINCYDLVVTKTVVGTYDERHTWDIDKVVDPTSQSGYPGDILEWTWTVTLSESSVDENFLLEGDITVSNASAPIDAVINDVADIVSGAGLSDVPATVDCGVTFPYTIPAGNSLDCTYDAGTADLRAYDLNTATATLQNYDYASDGAATAGGTTDYSGNKAVSYTKTVINPTADVDDDQEPDFPTTVNAGDGPWSWTETQSHTCSEVWADYGENGTYSDTRYNTATVTGSDGQYDEASADTTYTCEAGRVEVLKLSNSKVDPKKDWQFMLFVGPDGYEGEQVGVTSSTFDDADGVLDFGMPALRPDETYTVCEVGLNAGWSTFWKIGEIDIEPYNPDWDPNNLEESEDLGVRCFDFGAGTDYPVVVGETLTFEVDNIFYEGDARTPGYWKNWNTCSGGNQDETATKNTWLAMLDEGFEVTLEDITAQNRIDYGFALLDDILFVNDGIELGVLNIEECEVGVLLLNKSSLDGEKRASVPAFNLATALLAYQLNIGAGADTCEEAEVAAADAQTMLFDVGFDGTEGDGRKGAWFDKKDGKYINELAETLDLYNNNQLCIP